MFILLTLIIMLGLLIAFLVIGVASAGAAFLIIFGDVVVCALIIFWMIKRIAGKRLKH